MLCYDEEMAPNQNGALRTNELLTCSHKKYKNENALSRSNNYSMKNN